MHVASVKNDLFRNSIKQKMLLESRTLLWKECPTKCPIKISNNEIKNEDDCEVMEHFFQKDKWKLEIWTIAMKFNGQYSMK
jgi:hypothetical protein